MQKKIIRSAIAVVLLFCAYFLASRHIVIYEKEYSLLDKPFLTYEYTFYHITDKDPDDVMRIDMLREAGIGGVLVEFGMITEMEREKLEAKYEYTEEQQQ